MNMREQGLGGGAQAASLAPEIFCELRDFAYLEGRLLDEGRFEEWVELFQDEGTYWVPASRGQESPETALSLFHEAKPLLALRMRRLANPQTHVQAPPARTHHHLSNIEGADLGGGAYALRCMLLLVEWRNGTQRIFSACCNYRLRRGLGGLRIVSKRVDLLDCDAPQRAIVVPF